MSAIDTFIPPVHPVTLIAHEVARLRQVDYHDLVSERRTRKLVKPRHEAMYLAKRLTPASVPAIGRRLGGRDHTTVLHGIRNVEMRIAHVFGYGDELEGLEAAIAPKLPVRRNFDLVPVTDIDPLDVAQRVREALDRKVSIELFADEVGAMATALLAADQSIRDLQEELAERPRVSIARPAVPVVEKPKLPTVRTVRNDPTRKTAEAVVAAWDAFQSAQFSKGERFALQKLHRTLTHLKADISPATRQKDPRS